MTSALILTARQRRRLVCQFGMTLANLCEAEIYWDPVRHRIIARKIEARIRRPALPPHALFIGTYAHPFKAPDFLDDLDDRLTKLRIDASRAAA